MRIASRWVLAAGALALTIGGAAAQDAGMKKWIEGQGLGLGLGPQDEVGNLNEMTDQSRLAALKLVTQGKAYDLGLPYDRYSYKWPGHSPGEIISFRSPTGVRTQKDLDVHHARGRQHGHHRLALQRHLHERQRGDPDRRARPHHPRPEQRVLQRLQGRRMGRRLRPAQGGRHHHPADRRPRRHGGRRRLQERGGAAQELRDHAGGHRGRAARPERRRDPRHGRAAAHRHRPLLGRERQGPRQDRRARLGRHRAHRRQVAGGGEGRADARLRHLRPRIRAAEAGRFAGRGRLASTRSTSTCWCSRACTSGSSTTWSGSPPTGSTSSPTWRPPTPSAAPSPARPCARSRCADRRRPLLIVGRNGLPV